MFLGNRKYCELLKGTEKENYIFFLLQIKQIYQANLSLQKLCLKCSYTSVTAMVLSSVPSTKTSNYRSDLLNVKGIEVKKKLD